MLNVFRQNALSTRLPEIYKGLNPYQWTESLQISPVTGGFQVVLEEHNVYQVHRPQINPQLFVLDGYPVLVVIHIQVVIVPQSVLNPDRKGIQNEVVLNSDLRLEDVFHHLVNNVSFNQLEHSVGQILGLLPHGDGNEHLTLGVPVDTDVLDLLKLDDCARIAIFKQIIRNCFYRSKLDKKISLSLKKLRNSKTVIAANKWKNLTLFGKGYPNSSKQYPKKLLNRGLKALISKFLN